MSSRVGVILGRVLLLILAAVGLLWPHALEWVPDSSSPPADPVVITDYRAQFDVSANGDLSAVEDITADFPAGRHGIFRFWDVADQADPGVRYIPTVAGITVDGMPAQYETYWPRSTGQRFFVAKIGDPATYLTPGEHRYRISYTIPGVISPAGAAAGATFASSEASGDGPFGSTFLWEVVASGWQMRMARATVTINLPEPSPWVQCSVGPAAAARACAISGVGTQTVTVSAEGLAPRSGIVVSAAMGADAPERSTLPWSVAWDPILGRSVPLVVLVGLASGVALLAGAAWSRATREEPPGFPVQYTPPDGLGPVQVVFMHTEGVGPNPLVSTLLHMAERDLVRLESAAAASWSITGIAAPEAWEAQDSVTQSVADSLGLRHGATIWVSKQSVTSGKILKSATEAIGPAVRGWGVRAGYVHSAPSELGGRVLWLACAGLAVLGFLGLLWPTMSGLPFAMFAVGGVGLLATGVGRRRTTAGRLVWSRAGGFERLLSTPSAGDRFDFAARADLFIAYVPYAVAFGVADKWAAKYRAAVGVDPPVPIWYPYHGATSAGFYSGGDFDTFSSTLSSSISAYTASQSSSSGGGGGFGGGGGGGGGGGSW